MGETASPVVCFSAYTCLIAAGSPGPLTPSFPNTLILLLFSLWALAFITLSPSPPPLPHLTLGVDQMPAAAPPS
jgi:hypothetical protein